MKRQEQRPVADASHSAPHIFPSRIKPINREFAPDTKVLLVHEVDHKANQQENPSRLHELAVKVPVRRLERCKGHDFSQEVHAKNGEVAGAVHYKEASVVVCDGPHVAGQIGLEKGPPAVASPAVGDLGGESKHRHDDEIIAGIGKR